MSKNTAKTIAIVLGGLTVGILVTAGVIAAIYYFGNTNSPEEVLVTDEPMTPTSEDVVINRDKVIYLTSVSNNNDLDSQCPTLVAGVRDITTPEEAINALLTGPNLSEARNGLSTFIPQATTATLDMTADTIVVTLTANNQFNAPCQKTTIIAQITETLTTVDERKINVVFQPQG